MSEHDIANCPKCKQLDYVLKEDNVWICLNCGHTERMPKSRFDSQSSPDFLTTLFTVFIIATVIIVALGGRIQLRPNQNTNQEPQRSQ